VFSELISKATRDFPDHRPYQHFEALLKIYGMAVVASVLEQHELPIIGRYVLRALSKGIRTPQQIAQTLGLDEGDLAKGGAVAMSAGLMTYGPVIENDQRVLMLTPEGERFLSSGATITTAKKSILYLQFNPLTRKISLDRRGALHPDQARESGLPIIAGEAARPSLGLISLSEIRAIYRNDDRDRDILSLISLAQSSVAYLSDIQVFVLQHRQTAEERYAAYRGFEYLPEESGVLEEMRTDNRQIVPDDVALLEPTNWDVTGIVAPDAARVVQERIETDRQVLDLELQLASQLSATQPRTDEHGQLTATIEDLKTQLATLLSDRDGLQHQLEHSEIAFVATEQHRGWLERALSDAQEEVVIISPWMNQRAFDEPLMRLMAQTVARGVHIVIGYGFRSDKPDEEERRRNNIAAVKRKLGRIVGERAELELRDVGSTHQKILICDRQYGIIGSFNWLSYRGDIDAGYRLESSTLLRSRIDVERLGQLANRTLGITPRGMSMIDQSSQ